MGMAFPEPSSNPLGPDFQEPFEYAQLPRGWSGNGEVSGEMAKEEGENDDLARTPTLVKGSGINALAGLEPCRFDLGNVSTRRRSVDLSKRDGFPRGFSALGSRKMVTKSDGERQEASHEEDERQEESMMDRGEPVATTSNMDDSSRSMAVYFDSEQMDRGFVDDSPVYGSVDTELTPELGGSLHVRGESDDDDSEGVLESRLDATALSFQNEDEMKQWSFGKRKKKSAAVKGGDAGGEQQQQLSIKSQLHADFVLGANGGSKREGYISSRLFAKPLAGRVCLRNPLIAQLSVPDIVTAEDHSLGSSLYVECFCRNS